METQIRIWRVVPTSHTGSEAPTFFVENEENIRGFEEISPRTNYQQYDEE